MSTTQLPPMAPYISATKTTDEIFSWGLACFLAGKQKQAALASVDGEPAGYVAGPLVWNARQSETVVKITRAAQPEYGFVHPIYASPKPTQADAGCTRTTLGYALADNSQTWGAQARQPAQAEAETLVRMDEEDEDPVPPRVIDAPKAIWLTYGQIERDSTHYELSRSGDVSWCEDKIDDSDVCYVREDLVGARAEAGTVGDGPTEKDLSELLRQAHDESLDGNHAEARGIVMDVVRAMEARAALQSAQAVGEARETLEQIDLKAVAGLCAGTLGGAREFLKDVRKLVAAALANNQGAANG